MKSPFPGMDPYLEEHWGDVHQRLAIYASTALQDQLPGDLRARTEERVYVEHEKIAGERAMLDVAILERSGPSQWSASAAAGQAVLEPVAVAASERQRESFVEIREKGGGRVVTVIEFISPTNKIAGTGREHYRRKQQELEAADVHLVEIDLIRTGPRVFYFPKPLPANEASLLMATIRKGYEFRLFAFRWQDRLPVLPIPLRYGEAEITLDLQALHDQCYRDGAYDDIDYSRDPRPAMPGELGSWTDQWLRTAGRR